MQSSFQRELKGLQVTLKMQDDSQSKELASSKHGSFLHSICYTSMKSGKPVGRSRNLQEHTHCDQQYQGTRELSHQHEQTQCWDPRSSSWLLCPLIATLVLRN